MPFNLRTDRTDVRRKPRGRHYPSMKIAIGTFRLTKGNLNVNPKARHHRKTLAHPLVVRTSRQIKTERAKKVLFTRLLRFVANHLYPNLPLPWPIKLAKEDPLPGSK